MRLQFFSDLHLERNLGRRFEAADDVDVLILAGDIGSYQPGSRIRTDDFGLARFSPLGEGQCWKRVLFVPGNHEYDGLELADARNKLQQTCEQLGIEWLDQAVITMGPVRFVGSTLWSDFDALAKTEATLARILAAREKAFRAANFYLRKNTALKGGQAMMADALRDVALDSQAWLREALATPFAGKTVAVTHFAPSLRSADPRYGVTPGTAGFCNALDELFEYAELWIHGHLHCPTDYTVEGQSGAKPWRCRVLANPLGYAGKGEQQGFRDQWVVEV